MAAFGRVGRVVFFLRCPGVSSWGYGFLGLCIGAFLRDIGYYQVSRRAWPVTDRVIDWKQVQELVDSHNKPGA